MQPLADHTQIIPLSDTPDPSLRSIPDGKHPPESAEKTQLIASVFHKKNCVIAFYGVHYPNGPVRFMTTSSNLELNDSRRPFLHPGSLPGVSRWLKTKIQSKKEQ